MSDQASNIWSKQVKTTKANPHKTIHIPHSFERRQFFVISVFFCWCVIVCAIFFCWCADIPAAERDMSVFSLWDGFGSWMVKRQMLQMQNTRNQNMEIFFLSKSALYWPELAEKEVAKAVARLWIDFRIRFIFSEKIHVCTPNLQEEKESIKQRWFFRRREWFVGKLKDKTIIRSKFYRWEKYFLLLLLTFRFYIQSFSLSSYNIQKKYSHDVHSHAWLI